MQFLIDRISMNRTSKLMKKGIVLETVFCEITIIFVGIVYTLNGKTCT